MIRLTSAHKIRAVLAGGISTAQPEATVSYTDSGKSGPGYYFTGERQVALNGVTAVDICESPQDLTRRAIDTICIRNTDTANVTVTVKLVFGALEYVLTKVTLATLEKLHFSNTFGWYVTTSAGRLKQAILSSAVDWANPGAIGATTPNTGKFTTVESTVATGTAPLIVASQTLVTNLNADLLDGQTGSYYNDAGNLSGTVATARLGSGTASVSTFLRGDQKWAPVLGRNILIGGDFTANPWQRGTSVAAVVSGKCSADRWVWYNSSAAVVTISQVADAPTFAQCGVVTQHCLDVNVTTADNSVAAGDLAAVGQNIEGTYVADIGFGQSGTRYVTVTFWVNATKTGTYCIRLANSASNRAYVAEYTISAASTWEFKTVTIAVDTTGTWLYDTGLGLQVLWGLMAGSTYQTTAGSWVAGVNAIGTSNQVNAMDTIGNRFKLALAQVEVGDTPSTFSWRPAAQESLLCMRYYQSYLDRAVTGAMRMYGYTTINNYIIISGTFLTPMRIVPIGTIVGTWSVTNANQPGVGSTSRHGYEMYAQATATGIIDAYAQTGVGVTFDAEY